MTPRILAFAGSTRLDSLNRKLLAAAVALARKKDAHVTAIELADYEMPLYNGDYEREKGLPDSVKRLKALMLEHDRFLIASPEYNSSISPLLKNTIDWCSRPETEAAATLACFDGKIAGLLSASPGRLGGMRALRHLREILSNIGVLVVPEQFSLSRAGSAFDEAGLLQDSRASSRIEEVIQQLISVRFQ